jgi:hypothetical protein
MYIKDRVTLISGKVGEILDCFPTVPKTYRIRILDNREIVYFDESKLLLKRKHFLNILLRR